MARQPIGQSQLSRAAADSTSAANKHQRQAHMDIRVDDLSGHEIIGLLHEHLRSVALHSPPESVHALDLDALRKPDITFWSVWQDTELMGCGAIRELDSRHGEIKSMRTVSLHQRKGVAARLMRHILEEAKRRSYDRLSLETGSMDAFAPARNLYASFGFKPCGPFANYVEDPYSVFMTREVRGEVMAPNASFRPTK
jgi:putative acetyltransferase